MVLRVNAWRSGYATSVSTRASYTVDSGNAGPVISSVSADPDPVTGTWSRLSVDAGDADGDPLSMRWTIVGPTGSDPSHDDHAASPVVTFDRAGEYTVSVTVSDGRGESDSASRVLTVRQTASGLDLSP